MFIFWIIIGILFIQSIILIAGKGGWMIAGYNTASPDVKKRYNEKKLCRAFGIVMLFISAATIPLILLHSVSYMIFYFVFIGCAIVFLLIYSNKKCLNPGYENTVSESGRHKAIIIVTIIFVAAILIGVFALVFYGSSAPYYSLSAEARTFTIKSMYGQVISLSDIKSVELKTTLPDNLRRTNGYGGIGTVLKGYCSSSIGNVIVFLNTSIPEYIYITTTSSVIILNEKNEEQTKILYNELLSAMPEEH